MIKVGITGGIGSGKSYICQVFIKLGTPVYNADAAGKRLMHTSEEVKQKVLQLFGANAYEGENLNRKYISQQVFSNKELLSKLNNIVHPAVEKDFSEWCIKHRREAYVLKEAAILFESGSYRKLDKVIVIDAPIEERIDRVIQRDGANREDVLNRINNQWPADKIKSLADFVIINSSKVLILPQILEIHKNLTS